MATPPPRHVHQVRSPSGVQTSFRTHSRRVAGTRATHRGEQHVGSSRHGHETHDASHSRGAWHGRMPRDGRHRNDTTLIGGHGTGPAHVTAAVQLHTGELKAHASRSGARGGVCPVPDAAHRQRGGVVRGGSTASGASVGRAPRSGGRGGGHTSIGGVHGRHARSHRRVEKVGPVTPVRAMQPHRGARAASRAMQPHRGARAASPTAHDAASRPCPRRRRPQSAHATSGRRHPAPLEARPQQPALGLTDTDAQVPMLTLRTPASVVEDAASPRVHGSERGAGPAWTPASGTTPTPVDGMTPAQRARMFTDKAAYHPMLAEHHESYNADGQRAVPRVSHDRAGIAGGSTPLLVRGGDPDGAGQSRRFGSGRPPAQRTGTWAAHTHTPQATAAASDAPPAPAGAIDPELHALLVDFGQLCICQWYQQQGSASAQQVAVQQTGALYPKLLPLLQRMMQQSVRGGHLKWLRRAARQERRVNELKTELQEFAGRIARAPASAQIGILQGIAQDVDGSHHGSRAIGAAYATSLLRTTYDDVVLHRRTGPSASRRGLEHGPRPHPRYRSRLRLMDFEAELRLPGPAPAVPGVTAPQLEGVGVLGKQLSESEQRLAALAAMQGDVPLNELMSHMPVTVTMILDTKTDKARTRSIAQERAKARLRDAHADVPGVQHHHALEPRFTASPLLRHVFRKEYRLAHTVESTLPVTPHIVPLLHSFSCDGVVPECLPGSWEVDGEDEITGALPYYQTLLLVRPKYKRTLREDMIARRARRRNVPPFFREHTLLLYGLQIAHAIAHCSVYQVQLRVRMSSVHLCEGLRGSNFELSEQPAGVLLAALRDKQEAGTSEASTLLASIESSQSSGPRGSVAVGSGGLGSVARRELELKYGPRGTDDSTSAAPQQARGRRGSFFLPDAPRRVLGERQAEPALKQRPRTAPSSRARQSPLDATSVDRLHGTTSITKLSNLRQTGRGIPKGTILESDDPVRFPYGRALPRPTSDVVFDEGSSSNTRLVLDIASCYVDNRRAGEAGFLADESDEDAAEEEALAADAVGQPAEIKADDGQEDRATVLTKRSASGVEESKGSDDKVGDDGEDPMAPAAAPTVKQARQQQRAARRAAAQAARGAHIKHTSAASGPEQVAARAAKRIHTKVPSDAQAEADPSVLAPEDMPSLARARYCGWVTEAQRVGAGDPAFALGLALWKLMSADQPFQPSPHAKTCVLVASRFTNLSPPRCGYCSDSAGRPVHPIPTVQRPAPECYSAALRRLVHDLLRLPTYSGLPGDDKPRYLNVDEAIARMEAMLWCMPHSDEIVDAQWAARRVASLRKGVLDSMQGSAEGLLQHLTVEHYLMAKFLGSPRATPAKLAIRIRNLHPDPLWYPAKPRSRDTGSMRS